MFPRPDQIKTEKFSQLEEDLKLEIGVIKQHLVNGNNDDLRIPSELSDIETEFLREKLKESMWEMRIVDRTFKYTVLKFLPISKEEC